MRKGYARCLATVALLCLAMTAPHGAAVAAPAVKAVALEAQATGPQLVIGFDGTFAAPSLFALGQPNRIVIDLPGVSVAAGTVAGEASIARIRMAQFDKGRARIVVDLNAPVRVGAVTVADGNRLIVPLLPADDAEFSAVVRQGRIKLVGSAPASVATTPAAAAAAVAAATPEVAASRQASQTVKAKLADVPARADAAAAVPARPAPPEAAPARTSARVRSGSLPVVVIDAGHGGKDVGTISAYEGRYEKDAVLAIARATRRALEATGRYKVVMTRDSDVFLPLSRRVAIARANKAQLFISIHADSAHEPEVRGATIYTLSEVASDKEAARLAAKENRADVIAGVNFASETAEVGDILLDLLQRETMNVSAEFAATLQSEMRPEVHFKSNFHRFAGFHVLKAPDVPSVLVETGYLSNVEDSRFLFSERGREAIAKGIGKAVDAHFLRRMARR